MKVCVLGASGYLGSEIFIQSKELFTEVLGTYCNSKSDGLVHFDVSSPTLLPAADIYIWALNGYEPRFADKTLLALKNHRTLYISSDSVVSDTTKSVSKLSAYIDNKRIEESLIDTSKNVAIRIGPVYGVNSHGDLDKRTKQLLESCRKNEKLKYWNDVYKTFEPVKEIAKCIVDISMSDLTGTHFVGPKERESYYDFNKRILISYGLELDIVQPNSLTEESAKNLGIARDTSYSEHENFIQL